MGKRKLDREAIQKRFSEGETIKEIANDLNVTYNAIRQHIYPEEAKERRKKYYDENPEYFKEYRKQNWIKNKEAMKETNRVIQYRLKYGITVEEYEILYDKQNGVCAICGQVESRIIRGTLCKLSVDHDHETGKVRGLLCQNCNNMLGHAKDNPEILQKAVKYLEENNG